MRKSEEIFLSLEVTFLLLALVMILSQQAQGSDNMLLRGVLVVGTCVLPPGEDIVPLDFRTTTEKYLYQNTRTLGQPFTLHLTACDLSVNNAVRVTFSGSENVTMPGLLALDNGSQASGIGIGLETPEGQAVALNKPGRNYMLSANNTLIKLQAYLRAESEAIANKKIALGAFSATTIFTLEYE